MPHVEWEEKQTLPVSITELQLRLRKLQGAGQALNEERAKAAQYLQEPGPGSSSEIFKLQTRLSTLLAQAGTGKAPQKAPENKTLAAPLIAAPELNAGPGELPLVAEVPVLSSTDLYSKALDPLALAQALFRAGNYDGALKAYRLVPLEGLKADERAPVQYMMASCLKHCGNLEQAGVLFREVANSRGDPQVGQCAQWQLSAMRWNKEMSDRLSAVRQQNAPLEPQR